jgi:glutathione peroxidase
MDKSVYDFEALDIAGQPVALAQFKGRPLLIVNTASACGFTPQFVGLEELHQAYGGKGLVVLGFPCNQFGRQDPGSNEEIGAFCQKNYGVSFPMHAKISVNGPETHSLYTELKRAAPGVLGTEAIKWNFTKFLVDRKGNVVKRYASSTTPADIEADILPLL